MTTNQTDRRPLELPLAMLERELIGAYVTGAGRDLDTLLGCDDEEARKILAEASLFATGKLAEVESRSHYVRNLHGDA
jgi:hypothetical protein